MVRKCQKKLTRGVVSAVGGLVLGGAFLFSPDAAYAGGNAGLEEKSVVFHGFSITQTAAESPDNPMKTLDIRHHGASLPCLPDAFREVTVSDVQQNFPQPGCESVQIEAFTGGANCCFGYYVLSSCGGKDVAAFVEPFDGQVAASDRPATLSVSDPAFMYYEYRGAATGLSFSRVDSPRLARLMFYDGGTWRVDAKGEFPAYYQDMLKQVQGASSPAATKAVQAAYYRLMSGENAESAAAAFKRELPSQYAGVAEAVFADIAKAVDAFAPVRTFMFR